MWSNIKHRSALDLKLRTVVIPLFGLLLIASAFVPIGAYHGLGDIDVSGILWNFILPTGWFGIIAGIGLLFFDRIRLNNKRLADVIFLISLLLMMLSLLQDVDYHLSLWHGVKTTNFDVDSFILANVSVILSLLGTCVGLLLITNHKK